MDILQDSLYQTGNYAVLDVDQDHVRMSKFIESKLNCQYEDGKAFYEATENEEDLLYCKKILRPQTNEVFSYRNTCHWLQCHSNKICMLFLQ